MPNDSTQVNPILEPISEGDSAMSRKFIEVFKNQYVAEKYPEGCQEIEDFFNALMAAGK